ncbi:MAG: DUF4065 domain-containing protein [Bacteroidales bacterium]|nr:DUF4065 domain-containing protein [Bacteroidales bacterium]
MKSPITGKPMVIHKESGTLSFRKEKFEIMYHYYLCEDTGERFTPDDLGQVNIIQVHNQYREKHGIPFPDEIKKIREKYNLSARKMSKILGFGENSYRNYEAGEIPSVANGRLILAIKHAEDFKQQVEASTHLLSETEKAKLDKTINKLINEEKTTTWSKLLENQFLYTQPNEYSGYKEPQFDKIACMITFFSSQMKSFKTKLNKLLFFADFLHYSKTGFSITGLTYRAIPLGPVPAEYDKLYIKLAEEGKVYVEEMVMSEGNYAEIINGSEIYNEKMFEDTEKKVLNSIIKQFRSVSSKEIVELSHQYKAWKDNQEQRNLINYQHYAFDIDI